MSEQAALLPENSDTPVAEKRPPMVPDVFQEEISCRQYRLPLRGNSLNPMIDAATPLLGLSLIHI